MLGTRVRGVGGFGPRWHRGKFWGGGYVVLGRYAGGLLDDEQPQRVLSK